MKRAKRITPDDDSTTALVRYRELTLRLQDLQDRLARPHEWIPRWREVIPDFDPRALLERMNGEAVRIQGEIDQAGRSGAFQLPSQGLPPRSTAPQSLAELLAQATITLPQVDSEACVAQFGIETHPSDGTEIMYNPPDPPDWGASDWEFKAYLQSGTTELVTSPQDATGLAFKGWVSQMYSGIDPQGLLEARNQLWTVFVLEYTFPEAPCDVQFSWAAELVASFPNGVVLSGETWPAHFYWAAVEDPSGEWSLSIPTPPLWIPLLDTSGFTRFDLGTPTPVEHHEVGNHQGSFQVDAGVRPRLFLGLHVQLWADLGTVAVGGWNSLAPNSNLLNHGQLTVKTPGAMDTDTGSAPGVAWSMVPMA